MYKNHGLDLNKEHNEQSEQDYVFGGSGPTLVCITDIPEAVREDYLPQGEVQRGVEDFMSCATMSVLNILETKFTWLLKNGLLKNEQWLRDNGYVKDGKITFSDRFTSTLSGTTRNGNSLKAPLDSVRVDGLIPKAMLPANSSMTFDDFHSGVTPQMTGLGAEFAKRFKINYERVYAEDYEELLDKDMLDVAAFAWEEPINGVYPRSDHQPNHAFLLYKNPAYYAFDNYLDEGKENDFIKKLAPDYSFISYGYRVTISNEESNPVKKNWLEDILKKLYDLVKSIIKRT